MVFFYLFCREYWFYEENLKDDFYLRSIMDPHGYCPLSWIMPCVTRRCDADYKTVLEVFTQSGKFDVVYHVGHEEYYMRSKTNQTWYPLVNGYKAPG